MVRRNPKPYRWFFYVYPSVRTTVCTVVKYNVYVRMSVRRRPSVRASIRSNVLVVHVVVDVSMMDFFFTRSVVRTVWIYRLFVGFKRGDRDLAKRGDGTERARFFLMMIAIF